MFSYSRSISLRFLLMVSLLIVRIERCISYRFLMFLRRVLQSSSRALISAVSSAKYMIIIIFDHLRLIWPSLLLSRFVFVLKEDFAGVLTRKVRLSLKLLKIILQLFVSKAWDYTEQEKFPRLQRLNWSPRSPTRFITTLNKMPCRVFWKYQIRLLSSILSRYLILSSEYHSQWKDRIPTKRSETKNSFNFQSRQEKSKVVSSRSFYWVFQKVKDKVWKCPFYGGQSDQL